MTEFNSEIRDQYFLGQPEDINWSAKRSINYPFYEKHLLPALLTFIEEGIRKVTYQPRRNPRLGAVVGISGGIDSTLVSYLVAESMERGVSEQRAREGRLILVNFEGLEEFPTQELVEELTARYRNIHVQFCSSDLRESIDKTQRTLDDLMQKTGKERTDVTGELTTRLICSVLNELATRQNIATIDTTNGTEYVLGEFTTGLGYDVCLLSDLYKSEVYALAKMLGVPELFAKIFPRNSAFGALTKPQLYFGLSIPKTITPTHLFEVLDPILYWLYEQHQSPERISKALGHSERLIEGVKRRIDSQKIRQRPPVFVRQTRSRKFLAKSKLSQEEIKNIIAKEMMGDRFEDGNQD